MKFETKYGPISVSDSTISEYEKLTRGPLSKYCVESVVGELPNKAASSQEKIDQAIIKDGQVEAEEIAEIERMNAAGQRVTISKGPEGQMLDIDDDGNLCSFYDNCMDIFKKITRSADIDTKRRIFNELIDMFSAKSDQIFEMVFDFISKGFDEKEFLLKMLEYTDKRLAKKDTPERRKKWILYRLQLMDKLNYSDDDILEYSRRYPEFREIREYLTERFIAKGNNEAAIKIIEETLGSEVNSIYESQRLHLELKELYKQTNDREKYIKELWVILTQLCISGMDIYREFKSLFAPDEWEEERELLYSSMKYQHMLPEYFVEEKLYDRLASYVFTNKNEYLIEEYEKYLADEYHELILAEYAEYLNKSAEQSADRSTYQRWADKLIHMKKLKGGKECVAEIIENWKTLYRNRPAMMQEIDRVIYEE